MLTTSTTVRTTITTEDRRHALMAAKAHMRVKGTTIPVFVVVKNALKERMGLKSAPATAVIIAAAKELTAAATKQV